MNRMIKTLALLAATATGFTAAAAAKPPSDEVPFVSFGGIRDWTASDDDMLYVQSSQRQWYEVDLAQPCPGLPFALRVGFDTGASDTLDSFSTVIVDGQRCPVAAVTPVASPPRAAARKNRAVNPAQTKGA